MRVMDLMSRNRFEAIRSFFHVALPEEEEDDDPLKKIRTVYEKIRSKCAELYQPLQELSVDERPRPGLLSVNTSAINQQNGGSSFG